MLGLRIYLIEFAFMLDVGLYAPRAVSIFGMADIHDRHRDMRLDVDNMSYEVNQGVALRYSFSLDYRLYSNVLLLLSGVIGSRRAHWKR